MAPQVLSDAELLSLLREGNHTAFSELYQRYFGLLFVHAAKKLGDQDEAADLVQELFANIWDKRESLVITGSLKGYLYTSTRNRILNFIAGKKTNDKYINNLMKFAVAGQAQADYRLREKDLAALIEKEVDALPERSRKIFYMSRRLEMTYKEIAEEIGSTEEAVKSQMKRALRHLRLRLGLFAFLVLLIRF